MQNTNQLTVSNQTTYLTAWLDQIPVASFSYDTQGVVTGLNQSASNLCGKALTVGSTLNSFTVHITPLHSGSFTTEQGLMYCTLQQGNTVNGEEVLFKHPDGGIIKLKWYAKPFIANDNVIGGVCTLIDITDYLNNGDDGALLAAIVNNSSDAIISKTLDGIITSWNNAAHNLFGYTAEEAIGRHISILIPEARLHEEDTIIGSISQGKKIDHFETVRVTKGGKAVTISLSVSPVTDRYGKIIGASKIVRDITERNQAEERQAMLAAIVDTSDDTILSKTLQGVITSWNKAAEKMFGYTAEEAIGKHISMLIPTSRLQEEDYIISNIGQGNKVDHFETVRLTKEGKEIPISLSVSPVMNSDGRVIGASKIARDISLQKATEQALKSHTHRLEIINSVTKIISEGLDLQKILQKVTDVTTELTGAEFGAFFYNTINESGDALMLYTLSGAPKEAFEQLGMPRNTVLFHPTFSGHGIVRVDDITLDARYGQNHPHNGMPKGHLPVKSYMAVPVVSRLGSVIGSLFFGHSEVGRFTAEHEALVMPIAAQAAIGIDNAKLFEEVKILNDKKDEFIGLASHELKTPLTSIIGYLQILNRQIKDEHTKKFMIKTLQQVKKLSGLVSDLLDVSKIEAGKLQLTKDNFDICQVVDDAIELIQHSNKTHTISFHPNIDNLQIYGDPQRIEQVIINLLTNAIKYSPQDNRVEVGINHTANEVQISVKDFGMGIPAEKLQHVFSRFYRVEDLNPNISGLGIGLYISHEIVSRHNGKLWVDSTLGQGSTFWLSLPVGDI
ncbi:PAS domain S-box protein [Mucilaginibacter sp. CSA2-8R]|uniref:sensor histidine kinase n=1 Tax=Mucilaginibacter sp. CSA2-8R TaxID=3141542 RepID=UPI00315CBA2F